MCLNIKTELPLISICIFKGQCREIIVHCYNDFPTKLSFCLQVYWSALYCGIDQFFLNEKKNIKSTKKFLRVVLNLTKGVNIETSRPGSLSNSIF